jgi:hypothetical protein
MKIGACALLAVYIRLQIHTLMLRNAHCFSVATVVARRSIHVIRTLSVLLVLVVVYTIFLLLVMNYTSFPPARLMRVELYCVVYRVSHEHFSRCKYFSSTEITNSSAT